MISGIHWGSWSISSRMRGDCCTQRSSTFLYTSNEQVEFEIKNTVPFILAPLKMKYFGINQTEHVQDLYEENDKTLIKEIKELLNK